MAAKRSVPKDLVSSKTNNTIYQLKISLEEIGPLIWRRVLVPSQIRLSDLHSIIQCVMPWTESHLHQFVVDEKFYGVPSENEDDYGLEETLNEKSATLSEIAPTAKSGFYYEYDFGDSWIHNVEVEKILAFDPKLTYPVCIDGAGCAPPEDCGGACGYEELLETLSNRKNSEYEEMKDWAEASLGHKFDPKLFDLKRINKLLSANVKLPKSLVSGTLIQKQLVSAKAGAAKKRGLKESQARRGGH
jgi:hypothetical protein